MRINKIKIIGLVAILFLSVATFAAGPQKTAEQRATIRMQKLNEVCGLTAQQQTSIKALFVQKITKEDKAKESQKVKGKTTDPKAQQAALQAENKEFFSSLQKILTPDQRAKWKAYNQAQKKK